MTLRQPPVLAIVVLCACSLALSAAPTPPTLRLGNDVVPRRVNLDLTLSPLQDQFTGHETLAIRINREVDHFWLNARDLSVTDATMVQNGQSVTAQIVPGGDDFVGFVFPASLHAGDADLTLTFKGSVNQKSSAGLFSSARKNDKYLFTQFEAIDARRAFPCFDEPSFKIPWKLTLHVPQDDAAVSNTSIHSETPEANGMKAVEFVETKPLPSYLVAYAVGPFKFVAGGVAGSRHVPVRIVVPRGDEDRAKYAASVSAEILTRLENYYKIPYPFDKADQLAVPLSFGGAMENPGLVTYDANILLAPPGQDTLEHQKQYASVAAHELAHQWTGDMVTMGWWNDTWLNESFATWMSARLLAEWKPEWHTRATDETARLYAMAADTHADARRINQPAESKSDIGDAFDGITYQKGGAVLAMFENAVGSAVFQRVMHDYLEAHMFGNATAEDFVDELSKHTKPEYGAAFDTFLNQNGVPALKAKLECAPGKHATVHLTQSRLLPEGSSADANRQWSLPVCIAYSNGKGRKNECKVISGSSAEVALAGNGCPVWFLANSNEIGYYEVEYDAAATKQLFDNRSDLSLAEQVGVLGDVNLLAQTSQVSWQQTLSIPPQLEADNSAEIMRAAIRLADVPYRFLEASDEPKYSAYIEGVFGERARRLGWMPKPTDADDAKVVRPTLVAFVAQRGADPQLVSEAKDLANRWLDNHDVIPADLVGGVLRTAAMFGDAGFYDKVLAAAKKEQDPSLKPILVNTLGRFMDPALIERSLTMAFDGTFDVRLSTRMLFAASGSSSKVAGLPYQYVKEHYDDVVAKLPSSLLDTASYLPGLSVPNSCSDTAAAQAKEFFEPKMKNVVGGQRALSSALEQIHLCSVQRPNATQQISQFLASYSSSVTAGGGQ